MATLAEIRQQYPQYGDMSDSDLASALHGKFYADMPREDFDKKLGLKATAKPEPDPYRETAQREYDALKAKGIPVEQGLTRRIAQGATLGAADEILAGALTPLEMIKRGTFDPREGYRHAKAMQDVAMDDARKTQGVLGHVAEIGGGVGSGIGLARAGATLVRPGASFLPRTAAMAGEGAAYGGATGFLDGGNSFDDRFSGAGKGAAIGAGVGAALPVAGAVAGTVAAPIISNIRARTNPQGVAASQMARALDESGRPVADVVGDVTRAANEGQGMYTVADALGNSGQRLLSTVTRAPGRGRTEAVEFLEQRQAGQGRRVANTLAEGFDSPQTAAQAEAALTRTRDDAADIAYVAARQNAAPVDVSRVIANIDDTISPGVNQIARPQSGIANDSIEGALDSIRRRLTDGRSNLTDFTAIQRVRGDLSDMIQSAQRAGQGNRARLLGGVLREMDTAMESASQGFRQANRNFAQGSRDIESVAAGRDAAMRGRSEDIIPEFRGMPASQQAPFRTGYVDPLIEQAQGGAHGVNKARPLTSDAFRDEAAAIAPGNPLMQRRIDREMRMFETRNHATGNSRTADNLADAEALRVDPSIVAALLSGNFGGAARQTLAHASNALHGNTPAVRENMAQLLMQRGVNPTLANDIAQQLASMTRAREIALALSRGAVGGSAVGAVGAQRSR
jgi:hypothetical protein